MIFTMLSGLVASGNIAEAIITGKNAAIDCAALTNWDE